MAHSLLSHEVGPCLLDRTGPREDGAMLPQERTHFVSEACLMLRLLEDVAGTCSRYDLMLRDYRTVADTLGCRAEFEAALSAQPPPGLNSPALAADTLH